MFYYINQPPTPSFVFVLVKTESDCIVRSVETGLGRCMLVVAVISVDACPLMASSNLTWLLEDKGIVVFWFAVCCIIVRTLNMEVATKRKKIPWYF